MTNLDFSSIKVLLIGDFMIDHYVIGTSSRVSPEADVPVMKIVDEHLRLGGAGNVALNLKKMGANVMCMGYVGDDKIGRKLLSLLKKNDIDTQHIKIIDNYITTLKKRFYSNGSQVLRIDEELLCEPYDTSGVDFNKFDVVIISDYNKGVVKEIDFRAKIILVDPKKSDFSVYKNSHIITPNNDELQAASNIIISDDNSVIEACNLLIKKNNFEYIVAKRGERGMIVVGKNNFVKKINAHKVKNPDVNGAGDTVISLLSLAYAKTRDIEFSSIIANLGASLVVEKIGTETTNKLELVKRLNEIT